MFKNITEFMNLFINAGEEKFIQIMTILKSDYEIQTTMVVSTGHISMKDSNLLTRDAERRDGSHTCAVDSFQYGFYIYIPEEDDSYSLIQKSELYSDAFKNLIRIAREHSCQYLKLDRDGQTYPGLKTFDW